MPLRSIPGSAIDVGQCSHSAMHGLNVVGCVDVGDIREKGSREVNNGSGFSSQQTRQDLDNIRSGFSET